MSKNKKEQHKDAEQSPKSRFYHDYFDSIKGKDVKIYRGGPEAKHGEVVDVQADYVALAVKNLVVYYQAEHIKSISEPTKPKPAHHQKEEKKKEKPEFISAKNFRKLLKKMEQKVVQLNQGGPESVHGMLLKVGHDFLMLHTDEDGLVYVNIHHVKSVSQSSKAMKSKAEDMKEKRDAHDLFDVLKSMENKWVAINRGGPEAVEGVLTMDKGFYMLYRNEEVVRVDPFHIRSVSSGPKKKDKDKHDHKGGKKDGHDGKNKDKDKECQCDCKFCERGGGRSGGGGGGGKDKYKDCKDDDKDDSKSCKRSKDWGSSRKGGRKDSGCMNLYDDDNSKEDKNKYDNDNNKDDNNKNDNKYDNDKNDNKNNNKDSSKNN